MFYFQLNRSASCYGGAMGCNPTKELHEDIKPALHSLGACGMPERFAQAALGHNSKAIHRAYAKKAIIIAPSLEDYEKKAAVLPAALAA